MSDSALRALEEEPPEEANERRSIERRFERLQWKFRVLVAEFKAAAERVARVDSSVDSRWRAIEAEQRHQADRLSVLEKTLDRADGAITMIKWFCGVGGVAIILAALKYMVTK
jgi:hypothetical protein